MKFALACEGITDQITIENILCGFFNDEDLEDEITYLQPPFDETELKQSGTGGWTKLLNYLKMSRFRDDVLNNEYVIIQIDTDISESYDVKHINENDEALSIKELVSNVIKRLITKIEEGRSAFYREHKDKIIFCVCVHSIECWLLVYHCKQLEITDCFEKLKKCVKQVDKKRKIYDQLSQPFLEKNNLLETAKRDKSLSIFLDSIANQAS